MPILVVPATPIHHNVNVLGEEAGQIVLKLCTIDFGNNKKPDHTISEIQFGDTIYQGVTPLKWNAIKPTVADCVVTNIRSSNNECYHY